MQKVADLDKWVDTSYNKAMIALSKRNSSKKKAKVPLTHDQMI
jgi:hypothetical protein